jgi:mono/diheme cytochrome c family protein
MSAFAQKEGGMLTDEQINSIVHGIRERWSKPNALGGDAAPPYAAKLQGDASHGQATYDSFCAACHGPGGTGGSKAGSIVDKAYLGLITDQGLRTIVIAGRPDFNAPDWRSNVPGHPMSDQEITDVLTWLVSQRPNRAASAPAATSATPGGAH